MFDLVLINMWVDWKVVAACVVHALLETTVNAFIVISCHVKNLFPNLWELMDTISRLIVFDICYDCPAAHLCQTSKLLAMYGFFHLQEEIKVMRTRIYKVGRMFESLPFFQHIVTCHVIGSRSGIVSCDFFNELSI